MPRGARYSPGWAADLSDDSDVVSLHAAVGLLRSPARAIEIKVSARHQLLSFSFRLSRNLPQRRTSYATARIERRQRAAARGPMTPR